jgi:uncharacterized surface protein with fasciclin (FAS1) repeats
MGMPGCVIAPEPNFHTAGCVIVMSGDLSNDMMVKTVQGGELTIMTEGGVTVNGANVVTADVEASNGVIHVIDAVLLPK